MRPTTRTAGCLAAALAALLLLAPRMAVATEFRDTFRSGSRAWKAGPAWSVQPARPGFSASAAGDEFAWNGAWLLDTSWSFSARFTVAELRGERGNVGLGGMGLAEQGASPAPKLLATVERHSAGVVMITVEWFEGGRWHSALNSGWLPGKDHTFRVELSRAAGDDHLRFALHGDRGLAYSADTPRIPCAFLNSLAQPGLRANQANVRFTEARVATPAERPGYYRTIATAATHDLLRHFWFGDGETGHAAPTWNGYVAGELPDSRGALWERGTLITTLESLYLATGDDALRRRIAADWRHTKESYTALELETAGTGVTPASDDCGWNALGYLRAYRATGDPDALAHAKGLVNSSFTRWMDDRLGGGMWYDDSKKGKSLYEVGIVSAALDIWDITKEPSYRDHALSCYNWMERRLLRPDGLYWCDLGPNGPFGGDRPNDIHEAGSVTFLTGNMAMGVLHARLYRMTGDDSYRLKAIRTADAILARLTDGRGVLLDERDAWVNGTFAGDWARAVLTLPGIRRAHQDLLRATARAIYTRDRTDQGYYGGCWNGPADGAGSVWSSLGSRPQQVMTSANAVGIIVAAAALDAPAQRPAIGR